MKLAAAFCLSLVTRAAYLVWHPPPFSGYYWDLSTSLLEHRTLALDGVRTARFEPLYPMFIAGARIVTRNSVFGVQLLQCGVASLGAVLLFLFVRALARERVAIIASLLFAVHPLLIRHAGDMSDSAMTTTALLLFVFAFAKTKTPASAIVAGVCLGLTVLTRSVVLPLMVLAPALLLVTPAFARATARQAHVAQAVALAAAALVTITPMLARDYALNGTLLPPRQGVNLFIGNSDYTAALLPEHSPDILEHLADTTAANALGGLPADSPGFGDKADAVLSDLAWQHIKAHPVETLELKLRNAWYFVSPFLVPSHLLLPDTAIALGPPGVVRVDNAPVRALAERATFTAFSSVLLVLALAGIALRGRAIREDGILWLSLATFVAVYSLYFPATRYSAPVIFVPLFYAAVAMDAVLS